MKIALKQDKLSRHINCLRKSQEQHTVQAKALNIDNRTLKHREKINRAFNINTFKELGNYKFMTFTLEGMLIYVKDENKLVEVRV